MENTHLKLRVLEVSGTPHAMGQAHGEQYAADIRAFAQQRLDDCCEPSLTGKQRTRDQVRLLVTACLPYHEQYYPAAMDELRGLSAASGVSIEDLIVLNGFTDLLDALKGSDAPATQAEADCTAFLVSPQDSAANGPLLGQTWDMNREATPYILILRATPNDGPRYTTLTLTGCLAMIGMNEAGIAVGITNLSAADGRAGLTWTFVIRKILAQTTLADAVTCIMDAPLAGGHDYYLADSEGQCINIEAMPTRRHTQRVSTGTLAHTNHCLATTTRMVESSPDAHLARSTNARYHRAAELLQKPALSVEDLMAITRDHGGEMGVCIHPHEADEHHVESGAAVIMSPTTRELWAVWGNPCQGEFEKFIV